MPMLASSEPAGASKPSEASCAGSRVKRSSTLGILRLLHELDDAAVGVDAHDAEARRRPRAAPA